MQEKNIDEIIRLALTGEASRKEMIYLDTWLAESEQNRKVFQYLQLIWQEKSAEPEFRQADAISERIWREGVANKTPARINLPRKPAAYLPYYAKIAAVFLLVLSLPLLVFMYRQSTEPAPVAIKVIEKHNPAGQKVKLHLPDGSFAWLNAESTLSYVENFEGTTRLLELEGEAYFEVKKDPAKPFVVKSGKIATTAIGTAFNISAYPDDSLVQVALLSGKIKVNPEQPLEKETVFFLQQGDGIDFNKNNESRRYQFDSRKVTAWQQGILLFDGDSFEEVKVKLRRWYGVEISVTGTPPHDWKLTGRFTNEHLAAVLENIRFGRNFTYDLTGNQLTFDFTTIKS